MQHQFYQVLAIKNYLFARCRLLSCRDGRRQRLIGGSKALGLKVSHKYFLIIGRGFSLCSLLPKFLSHSQIRVGEHSSRSALYFRKGAPLQANSCVSSSRSLYGNREKKQNTSYQSRGFVQKRTHTLSLWRRVCRSKHHRWPPITAPLESLNSMLSCAFNSYSVHSVHCSMGVLLAQETLNRKANGTAGLQLYSIKGYYSIQQLWWHLEMNYSLPIVLYCTPLHMFSSTQ